MGCPCSKRLDNQALPNPLQQLKAAEAPPRVRHLHRRRQEEKRLRQLAKLQKRNARKRRHQRVHNSATNGGDSATAKVAPQLRLRGGSNGSSTTECISALYARTLEQQREDHQLAIELKMGHQLERQLYTFLLNQLLLGIQFFGHFEHELAAIEDQLLAKQRACSQTLSEHSLLHASAIDVAVAKRLLFQATDGPHRGQDRDRDREREQSHGHASFPAEPLQKPLTYVVFENVDVAKPNDANYDSISALCKVLLETDYYNTTPCRAQYVQLLEQSRWMGYVRLKLREATPIQRSSSGIPSEDGDVDNEGVYTDGSSGYSTGTGTGTGRRGSWDEGDYDHVYIARLNTQRSLAELKLPRVELQRNVLPEECICRLGSCLPAWLEQSDDEVDSNDSCTENEDEDEEANQLEQRSGYETVQVLRQCRVEQLRRRMLLQQCYLSSQQFMHYFGELLRQQLAEKLDISQMQLSSGSYRGCSIFTSTEELVPAIHVPHGWPDCAFEFNLRARPQLTDLHTGDKYQWPTAAVRKRIQSFGFHVVPVGYAPKRARNPFRELEWRIIFPQAELLLERQLSRMQLKMLLLMKTLVRSYVNDKCQAMGHIMEQLRTHLFWQCERHGNEHWNEEFLGEQLVRFVRSFVDCLAKKQLSDYFIERRNLFEHVPEDALMELRSIMAGIAEQPLLHMLQALRNLQHAQDFYPKLNYAQVLDTLLTVDYLQLRNKAKFSRNPLITMEQEEISQEQGPVPSDPQGLVGMRLHQERTRGKLRRKTQLLRAQQLRRRHNSADSLSLDMPPLLLLLPRASRVSQASHTSSRSNSFDSANAASSSIATTPQLNDGVEILRRTNLLELLLDHMLAMLSKATEFRNAQHGQLYLEQAQRLCRLYQQLGCSQNAQHYAEAICQAASGLERSLSCPTDSSNSSSSSRCSPSHRKSLKFVEHVVQLHTGQVLPLQRPAPPSSTLRVPASAGQDVDDIVVETPPQVESMSSKDATTTIATLGTLFQRMQIDSPVAIKAISSKTEQLMQNLELRDLLKRNTQKLKSAFN
ncbi:uncharacterized protein LOC117793290 [Drosophila innubila]|uniref:uncharacterized protein LOC117793290 n=1 Tax=Drosophila innubila TaxID=198719 RepID=UPI00148C87E1|nr:uncharacterized protein LOC117793290 [Drosophila innubila]